MCVQIVWAFLFPLLYIVMCIPIARQRLGKHISVKCMRATEGRPLFGNRPINLPP
jgi:hypothetical protein